MSLPVRFSVSRAPRPPRTAAARPASLPSAVLVDCDGTLVEDVPYNNDPDRVVAIPGVSDALQVLRDLDVPIGVVTNQSGIARGLITWAQLRSVHEEIERQVGRFDVWAVCAHAPRAGCECRKPRPGLIIRACRSLHVRPTEVVVIGDIGSDVSAADAAGARSILVPRPATRPAEVAAAAVVADSLASAVAQIVAESL